MAAITAERIATRLCTTHKAGEGVEEHRGSFPVGDGYEFVGALDAWDYANPIRLLPDGGSWPYSFMLAADAERATIEYCEGDITVRIYDEQAAYQAALEAYAETQDADAERPRL